MAEGEKIKKTIAANIAFFRKKSGLTQLELAEKLNYSDKAVSKWESGASVPDITVLASLASLFGVSVDRLLSEDDGEAETSVAEDAPADGRGKMTRAKRNITMLSVALVWLIATAVFVFMTITDVGGSLWLSFIWALPVSAVVLIVLNSVWGNPRRNYVYISMLIWTLLASIYLTLIDKNLWLLFVMGVPGEAIVVLWSGMKPHQK